jgi:hypothetical protein
MFIKKFIPFTKSTLNISIVGGSNSVIRNGYTKYLNEYIGQLTKRQTSLKYYTLGGVTNIHGLLESARYNIAANSDIIFYEYGINDRYSIEIDKYSLDLAGKALEGFIRNAKTLNPNCIVVIVIFGVNLDSYYNNHCHLSELYESIGNHYKLPVINIKTLLEQEKGANFIRSLYQEKDHAHYTRPYGVKIVAETIVKYLENLGIIEFFKLDRKKIEESLNIAQITPIYADHFERLAFFDQLQNNKFFSGKPKVSVYQNSVFKETNYTIYPGMSFNFLLKGKLMAIFIKSDLCDGFIEINFGEQKMVVSSYSSWVDRIKPQNIISLISLPALKFTPSQDFAKVSLSVCQHYPQEFELDLFKEAPMKKNPSQWKLSIIGVAYLGEIMPLQDK